MAGNQVEDEALAHHRGDQRGLHQGEARADADPPAAAERQVGRAVPALRRSPAGTAWGRRSPGSGQKRSSWWIAWIGMITVAPFGIRWPSITSSLDRRARDGPGGRHVAHRLLEAGGGPGQARESSTVGRRSPSTVSISSSIRSRASVLSASRYHIHASALAVVSWPASMNVVTSSRTRRRLRLPSSSRACEQQVQQVAGVRRVGAAVVDQRPRRPRRSVRMTHCMRSSGGGSQGAWWIAAADGADRPDRRRRDHQQPGRDLGAAKPAASPRA